MFDELQHARPSVALGRMGHQLCSLCASTPPTNCCIYFVAWAAWDLLLFYVDNDACNDPHMLLVVHLRNGTGSEIFK